MGWGLVVADLSPGSGTDHPLDEITHGKEKKQKKYPGKFARNHGEVVISGVHKFLATGDSGRILPL